LFTVSIFLLVYVNSWK